MGSNIISFITYKAIKNYTIFEPFFTLKDKNPIIPDNKDATRIINLALFITVTLSKANNVMKIDIVNPIPAKKPTPIIFFQFKSSGNCVILNFTIKKVNNTMPNGFPITNPKIIPNEYSSEKLCNQSEPITIAVLHKANKGNIKNATGLCKNCSNL